MRDALREARAIYRQRSAPRLPAPRDAAPDVDLDVRHLHVDRLGLKVDALDARVALEPRVLDLLRLDVGVDATVRGVALDVEGVDAQAQLQVRLENLAAIVDRVMRTIEANPQLVGQLAARLEEQLRRP